MRRLFGSNGKGLYLCGIVIALWLTFWYIHRSEISVKEASVTRSKGLCLYLYPSVCQSIPFKLSCSLLSSSLHIYVLNTYMCIVYFYAFLQIFTCFPGVFFCVGYFYYLLWGPMVCKSWQYLFVSVVAWHSFNLQIVATCDSKVFITIHNVLLYTAGE